MSNANTNIRVVTNEDMDKYQRMVNMYLHKYVVKNWNEASMAKSSDEITLGNTGMSIADIRQHLMCEVVVALQKYNPDYRTKEGKSVLESTFVYQHLFNRCGQLMKKLTKKRYGYGVWSSNLEDVLGETDYYGKD
jgi:hypothetical protein